MNKQTRKSKIKKLIKCTNDTIKNLEIKEVEYEKLIDEIDLLADKIHGIVELEDNYFDDLKIDIQLGILELQLSDLKDEVCDFKDALEEYIDTLSDDEVYDLQVKYEGILGFANNFYAFGAFDGIENTVQLLEEFLDYLKNIEE